MNAISQNLYRKHKQKVETTKILPFIEVAIDPKEVFNLIHSGHEPLKQVGALLKANILKPRHQSYLNQQRVS